jgi:hypothetical protein
VFLNLALSRELNVDAYGPQLLRGISLVPKASLKGYFPIVMRSLGRWKFDYETPGLRERIGLEDKDISALSQMFEQLLLYDGTAGSTPPPPDYISKNEFPDLLALNSAKMAAIKFARGALGKAGSLTLFVGTKDGSSQVADFCTDAIKRSGIDLEDPTYIKALYELYFGGPRLNIRIGILESLSKSIVGANLMPQMRKVLDEELQCI